MDSMGCGIAPRIEDARAALIAQLTVAFIEPLVLWLRATLLTVVFDGKLLCQQHLLAWLGRMLQSVLGNLLVH